MHEYTGCTRKKLTKIKWQLIFALLDILFMNSFLILMFFKEGLTKNIRVLIISLVNVFTNGKKIDKNKLFEFRYHLTSKWIN